MLATTAAVDSLLSGDRRLTRQADDLAANGDLNTAQASLEIGATIPIIFGKRTNGGGGVWVSPLASECRFENDTANRVTASYECVICAGQLPPIQVGDIYQGDTPILAGEYEQAYNGRAGSWTPGNFIQQRFVVTSSYQETRLEGKTIGSGIYFTISENFSAETIAEFILSGSASGTVKSNGNYVTSFKVEVDKIVNWPQEGMYSLGTQPISIGFATPSFSGS